MIYSYVKTIYSIEFDPLLRTMPRLVDNAVHSLVDALCRSGHHVTRTAEECIQLEHNTAGESTLMLMELQQMRSSRYFSVSQTH